MHLVGKGVKLTRQFLVDFTQHTSLCSPQRQFIGQCLSRLLGLAQGITNPISRRAPPAQASGLDGVYQFGLEVGWHHHLQQLDVIAVAQLAVTDARRLVHAVAGDQPHNTLAFVLELDPTLEHVDQLELGAVQVRLAAEPGARHRADDMGHHLAAGGLRDAQVAILEKRPQAALESGIGRMVDGKSLVCHVDLETGCGEACSVPPAVADGEHLRYQQNPKKNLP